MRSIYLVFVLTLVTAISCMAQKHPVKPPAPSTSDGQFDITIEGGGNKTEIKSTQFQNADGFFLDNENGLLTIAFRADNDKDEKKISITGRLPKAVAGTYPLGIGEGTALFNIESSEFPKVPLFFAKSGSIEISSMPLAGGLIAGSFKEICENGTDDGRMETYTVSGSFKFRRGPAIH